MAQFEGESSQMQLDERLLLMDQSLKSGKIKSIHLKNFMCHANFVVNLNKNVNVFVGLNGSGKSAILTAIAIGLGSKASSTSRSTNLKDLVKRGEASASIEIALTNDGLDSFEGNFRENLAMTMHSTASICLKARFTANKSRWSEP